MDKDIGEHDANSHLRVVPVVIAIVGYGAFIFLGAWIDGRRQTVREKGLHSVTEPDGSVEAREYVDKDKTMSFRKGTASAVPKKRTKIRGFSR